MEYQNAKSRRKNKFDKGKKYIAKHPHVVSKRKKFDDPERANNIVIWGDTIRYFSEMKESDISESTLYNIDELDMDTIDEQEIFDTICEVKNEDTFDLALEYCSEGLNPMVLNMASEYKAGGGVQSGSRAQEECLFRRSNAHLTHPKKWYPLKENQVIYSPEVYIVKDSEYNLLKKKDQYSVGMISVPAVRRPNLIKGEYKEKDLKEMTNKIESIFHIGIMEEHDSLVLGALGCGAFRNPPEEVASIFRDMIDEYGKYFKKIGFAVLVAKNSDTENLDTFENIIMNENNNSDNDSDDYE